MKSFTEALNEELLDEGKTSKAGVDIGDGFKVHKVGNDANGNWSYWISKDGSKQKKVQVNGNVDGRKIGDVKEFKVAPSETIKSLKAYASKFLKF